MFRSVEFSPCGEYRYSLTRIWNSEGSKVLPVVGLNPSIADAKIDDPTIKRCIRFAQDGGWDGIIMLNLFALVSTNPQALNSHPDPIGPYNDKYLHKVLGQHPIAWVCWGNTARPKGREAVVLSMIREPICLGVTKGGNPRHPLYLPYSIQFQNYHGPQNNS